VIDYEKLTTAQAFYETRGFVPVQAPWIVSQEAMVITAEQWGGRQIYPIADEGFLVASGEQSFFQLIVDNKLSPGRWQCITPCFRDDPLDALHQRYFIKLELIDTRKTNMGSLIETISFALDFFRLYVDCRPIGVNPQSKLDRLDTSVDIVTTTKAIELGSYGIRAHPKIGRWLYATGCAEPRLSQAVEMETKP